jgi:hypothetical protein
MLFSAMSSGSWVVGLAGISVLAAIGATLYAAHTKTKAELQPWPWPADLRAQAEAMARPIDPTPKRLLPPDEKTSMIAAVATTKDGLSRLIADKPPAWPWAVFTSVVVQRRNADKSRLGTADDKSTKWPLSPALRIRRPKACAILARMMRSS